MTGLLVIVAIISCPTSIIFGLGCICTYLQDDKDYKNFIPFLKVAIPLALISTFLIYCTDTCNVTYQNIRVHVVDGRAFIIDDVVIDIGGKTSTQYSDGDYVRKWNSHFLCFNDSGYDYTKVKSNE